jgi:hypothetical protein
MANYIQREDYLNKLIARRDNDEVKIITGPRRCGKSWLLKKIYKDYLLQHGVGEDEIIIVSFDIEDETSDADLSNREALKKHLYDRITDEDKRYYVFLDEVQEVDGFEKIVNGLNAKENVDVYITGSNSKFLSSDINTLFRGRGDEVRINPFSFKEFCTDRSESINELWKEYYTYGGMPALRKFFSDEQKVSYLNRLWNKTYLDDVVERNDLRRRDVLESLTDSLCSSVGSLTNANRIKNLLESVQRVKVDVTTVHSYIGYLQNAYLFEGAKRYDVKGNRYYDSIQKYYAIDVGLRNARLNFRQQEPTHIMENVIYNELRCRGYTVDVGVVESRTMKDGKSTFSQHEIDFVITNGRERAYIQSAYRMPDDEKREQELYSLRKTGDSFKKIVIVGDDISSYTDAQGIQYIGLFSFLLSSDKLL